MHLSAASAEHWRQWTASVGALVCGRELFEHPDAPFTFVTDGVEAAIARARDIHQRNET